MKVNRKVFALFLGLVLIVVFVAVVYFQYFAKNKQDSKTAGFTQNNQNDVSNPTTDFTNQVNSNALNSYDIVPGESTLRDLTDQFGEPTKVSESAYLFKSENEYSPRQAVFRNGELAYFLDTDTRNISFRDMISVYGETEDILYGSRSEVGDHLYNYPSKGVSFLGNREFNEVYEIWYYEPTTLSNLQNSWALGYATSPEETGHTYPH